MIQEQILPSDAEVRDARPLAGDGFAITAALGFSAVYATVRYNVFKGVAWSDWPHYTGSKILALASLILIAVAVARLAARQARPIRRLMAVASGLAIAHALVSLGLLDPGYYESYFAGDRLTLTGGGSVMLGALAVALLQWGKGRRGSSTPDAAVKPLALLAFLSGLHAALPATANWFAPEKWPGGMPPITLISFLIGLAALGLAAHRLGRANRPRA